MDSKRSTSAKASSVVSNLSTASSSCSSQVSDRAAESLLRPDSVIRTAVYGKAHALYSFHADRNNSRYLTSIRLRLPIRIGDV